MRENLQRALAEVFGHEGGYSSIRSDPGNWTSGKVGIGQLLGTKYGIAANSYPNLDIPNLTLAQAAIIYEHDYWGPAGCNSLFAGVDLAAFDLAVNSGVGRVRQLLPKAVGSNDHTQTVKRLCALRLSFMRSLRTWGNFGRGWSKRVARIEAVGVAWAASAMGRPVKETLDVEGKKARNKAGQQASGGIAAGGSAAGGTVAVDASSWDWTAYAFAGGLGLFLVLLAAFLIWRAMRNNTRAKAYRHEAGRNRHD